MTEPSPQRLLETALQLLGERGDQYGPTGRTMRQAAEICEAMFGLQLEPRDIARVLFAVKMAREHYQHKGDNIEDGLAYLAILGSLSEKK